VRTNKAPLPHQASYYAATAKMMRDYPQLKGELETDICIVGGGFTGTSAALHLAEAGFKVCLLEANKIGWGASGRNGGQLCQGHNMDHEELTEAVGRHHADALWQASVDSVELVKNLIEKHHIDCDLSSGVLHVASKHKHDDELKESVEYAHSTLNFDQVDYLTPQQVSEALGTEHFFGGELYKTGAHIHPLNFALGMANAAHKLGAEIYESARVIDYTEGQSPRVRTENGTVTCKYLLFACNGYLGKLNTKAARKIMPINNFIIATEPLPRSLTESINPNRYAVADSNFVVNYFRLSQDNRMLWGGGENYTSKFPNDIASFVKKHMIKIYPELDRYTIDYSWGGTLAITLNRMPHIARQADNIFVAQGYSGHGVALATYAGSLFANAVQGSLEGVDVFEKLPMRDFPGGTLLRWPGLAAGMFYYSLRDKLPF
jgi:gamma-glutamylputrescine oxidase